MDRIRKELNDDDHATGQGDTFIPSRLLEIGFDNVPSSARLIETTAMTSCPRYAALSYCWGKPHEAAQQLKTMPATLHQHLYQIPTGSMTVVVREAIKVTRALSLRYLWIDALCIVQGDEQDWARESKVMGSVYSNAFVTICALSSSSCTKSFLERSIPIRISFRSTIFPLIVGSFSLRRQPYLDDEPTRNSDFTPFHTDLYSSVWESRAWTHQEMRLSRRKLFFGHQRIHLMKLSIYMTEPEFKPVEEGSTSLHDLLILAHRLKTPDMAYNSWYETASDMTRRGLTDRRDMIPSTSGLANLIAGSLKDDFVAGLWRKDINRGVLFRCYPQLPWSQIAHIRPCTRSGTSTYICPTWSWAHHSGYPSQRWGQHAGIAYQTSKMTHRSPQQLQHIDDSGRLEHSLASELESLNVWSQPEHEKLNPYGRIQSARILARAKILKVPFVTLWEGDDAYAGQSCEANFNGSIAICDLDWLIPRDPLTVVLDNVYMLLWASAIGDDYNRWVHAKRTHLHTFERSLSEPSDDLNSTRNAWGLLVHPIEKGKYVRVGLFKIWAQLGGLRAFQSCKFEDVELI
jgi:hypothetical protein